MIKMKYVAFFYVIFSSTITHALVVNDPKGKIEISIPTAWKYEKDLFGLPHVFLSSGDSDKISVSLTLTGIADVKLSPKELKNNQKDYQQGRSEWALSRNFTIINFQPYESFKSNEGKQVHSIGFNYKNSDIQQSEKSYYIECPETLVHLKALGKTLTEVPGMIKSLKCL